ncbi:hypothetical protein Trydic_g23378 [Trypoxylus dichotomus]
MSAMCMEDVDEAVIRSPMGARYRRIVCISRGVDRAAKEVEYARAAGWRRRRDLDRRKNGTHTLRRRCGFPEPKVDRVAGSLGGKQRPTNYIRKNFVRAKTGRSSEFQSDGEVEEKEFPVPRTRDSIYWKKLYRKDTEVQKNLNDTNREATGERLQLPSIWKAFFTLKRIATDMLQQSRRPKKRTGCLQKGRS